MDTARTPRSSSAYPAIALVVALVAACTAPAEEPSTTEAAPTTRTSTTIAPSGEGPNLPPIEVCPLLTLDEVDAVLGLVDLPLEERGIFTFERGEVCRWLHEGVGGDRFVEIAPGSPDDFEEEAQLVETSGTPVTGLGESAVWFGAAEAGILSVVQRTRLGFLFVRFTLQRQDLTDAGRLEVLSDLAARLLPTFPGMDPVTAASEPPDLSALSFEDNLLVKEAAGEWTRGEGLVATLRLFVGELKAAEVLRHPELQSTEDTGVLALAREYLETGDDAGAKAEVTRLLEILTVTNAELEEMAGIGQLTASLVDLVGAPAPEIGGCSAFFYGYDPLPTGVGPCLVFQSITFDGKLYRVFYPAPSMPGAGWTQDHYRWALEAMADTLGVYPTYGTMPAVNLVFSIFPGGALAETLSHPGEPCPVAVYTSMQALGMGEFKQVIAHELAHCFSDENYVAQNAPGYSIVKWREEGLADFMGNLVYPDVNREWKKYPGLERVELLTTIFQRAYINSIFFMYLAGRLGEATLLGTADPSAPGLIHTLPTSGGLVDQHNHLADYQNMSNLYHEFVQVLTDSGVEDTSGQLVPYTPPANRNPVSAPMTLQGVPMRFGVSRIHLVVGAGKTACLEYEATDQIQASWRPGPPGRQEAASGDWSSDLPETLQGEAVFLMTATTPGAHPTIESGQLLTIHVTNVVDDPDQCDEQPDSDGCQILECGPSGYYRFCFGDVCLDLGGSG